MFEPFHSNIALWLRLGWPPADLFWRAWCRRMPSFSVPPFFFGRTGSSFRGLMGRDSAGLHPVESPPKAARYDVTKLR